MTFVECRPTIEKIIHKSLLVKVLWSFTSLEFVSPGIKADFSTTDSRWKLVLRNPFSSDTEHSGLQQQLWIFFKQFVTTLKCLFASGDPETRSSSHLVPRQLSNMGSSGIFQCQGEGTGKAPGCLCSGLLELTGAAQHGGSVALGITSGWANAPLSWFCYSSLQGSSGE